jgi:membrane fusion protein (multidrug efflux system)
MNATVEPSNGNRRRGLLILAAVVIIVAVAYTLYWTMVARYYETTDDAYVASDIVQITSEVPGTVLAAHIDDTQTVEQGQPLVDLDPADARIGVSAAEADLARTVRQVMMLFTQADQQRALIAQREIELKRAEQDFARRQTLVTDGAVSGEELAHGKDTTAQQRAALEIARQQLQGTLVQTEGTTVETHPDVLAAAARLRNAALALHRTKIVAPVAGVIAKRSVQVGQRIAAGAPLVAVVPLDSVWIDANFKEGQLKNVRVGQPVEVHADLYGDDIVYAGKVAGVSAGSGSAFALLPAQNASGNWIKVVQRLPVRITLDPKQVQEHPLRVGLSMHVKIDAHDTSGDLVAAQLRTAQPPTQRSDGDDPAIEARIASIIAENMGGRMDARRVSKSEQAKATAIRTADMGNKTP